MGNRIAAILQISRETDGGRSYANGVAHAKLQIVFHRRGLSESTADKLKHAGHQRSVCAGLGGTIDE